MKKSFLDELNSGILLGDGAIGTELFARGAPQETGVERLNILAPDLVLRLHQDYIAAGSQVIETNTFGANRFALARHGVEDQLREILLAGARIARKAAGERVYVAGSIGPLPSMEGEPLSDSDQRACFAEQTAALLDGGVDLLILESFANLDDLVTAVSTARAATSQPIIAQMAFGPGGRTDEGFLAHDVAVRCRAAGADVVGANCGYGVPSVIEAIKHMSSLDIPMSAFMNAGFAGRVEGRLVYLSTPKYLADRAKDLVGLGVRLIGGCCGTGPEYIRAIAETVFSAKRPAEISRVRPVLSTEPPSMPVAAEKVFPGRVLVEIDPPITPDISKVLAASMALKGIGVDAITVADNPLASVRVDTLTVAALIQQESKLPVIPHLTGRDRNRIALQSTVMGAYVLGIRNVLCVTGDPVRMSQDTNTTGVFDVNSIGLVRLVADFNSAHCAGGSSIAIGVALNPVVRSLGAQISKLQRKIDAGASYVLTQPIFSVEQLDCLQEALSEANITTPVYIGVLPLASARNAEFLHNEVPGIFIPDYIHQALAKYDAVADQRAVAAEICESFIRKTGDRVHGFYVIAPGNRVEPIRRVLEAAKGHRS